MDTKTDMAVTDPHKFHKGIYDKFTVYQNSSGKLLEDFVFVLRPHRDPIARDALRVYAKGARQLGFIALAEDIEEELDVSTRR